MNRQDFLKNLWIPYPQTSFDAVIQGRILEIAPQHLTIARFEKPALRISAKKLKENCDISVLEVGDIVSINVEGVVTLHCPAWIKSNLEVPYNLEHVQRWSKFKHSVHEFFQSHAFIEIETPSLVPCPGSEPTLDVFSCQLKVESKQEKLFLPTSPEWHLKKALAMNIPNIYEIKSCFRNGEITSRHQPEFTMLEWYRAYANLQSIKKDALQLIDFLCEKFEVAKPRNIHSFSVSELFLKYLNFELTPLTTEAELRTLARAHNIDLRAAESIDDCFYLIFMEKIENQWSTQDLVFVENYPPYQAALARLTPEGWGDRFEIYWKGYELANAFHELNDPKIQRQRFNEDLAKKHQLGKESIRSDEEFFTALERGLPPSGGIALGLERLYMALFEVKDISQLKLFPYKTPQFL